MATVDTPEKKKNNNNNKKKQSLRELKTLGQQLLESRAHINNLPVLLSFISPDSPPPYAVECLLSLQSFFTPIVSELPSSHSSTRRAVPEPDPEAIYRAWLRSKFDDFVLRLVGLATSSCSDDALREVVLEAIMEFVKVGNAGKFHSSTYHKLLHAIVHSTLPVDDVLLDLLASNYFKYIDVRYFTYISMEKLARTLEGEVENFSTEDNPESYDAEDYNKSSESMELPMQKIHYLLSHIPLLEASGEKADNEMWNASGIFNEQKSNKKRRSNSENINSKAEKSEDNVLSAKHIAKKLKLKVAKAWLSFLRLPLPLDVYKEVLVSLHQSIIPNLSNPVMLCDFLTRSYDMGGVISVMALSSLFILMTQHGLEFPNFYDKLYALLEPSIFLAKHRAKFFQLLDSCLKSSLLPAYLAAAFCKRLSRLALFVPPSGSLVIVALVHNLLQRHPSINCLVHRESIGDEPGIDHFRNEENDPKDADAIRSSLWEVDTLRNHYCAAVSRFAISLEDDLAVRAKTAEIAVKDFSSGSYATIFNDEMRRRVKQVPLAFYKATPTCLFSDSDFDGWTFKSLKDDGDASPKRQRVV